MAKVTKKQVVTILHSGNYEKGSKLGRPALKHLQKIAQSRDWELAPKAVYLAGLIGVDASVPIVEAAAKSRKPAMRVAAASAAPHLAPEQAEPILLHLLDSRDVGIRKCAIQSVEEGCTTRVRARLGEVASGDPEPKLRRVAARKLKK